MVEWERIEVESAYTLLYIINPLCIKTGSRLIYPTGIININDYGNE